MTSDEDADDLNRLRERVYGPEPGDVSPSDLDRLRVLEDRQLPMAPAPAAEPASPAQPAVVDEVDTDAQSDEPDLPVGRRRRWPMLVAAGLAVILAAGVGYAVGVSQPEPPPLSQPPLQSELSLPQTEEDILQSPADAGVDSITTRFLARLDGYDIYVGFKHQADTQYFEDVPCIIATTALTSALHTVACGDVATRVGVDRFLEVGIGNTGRNELGADRILLSENVVAYRYGRALDE